MTANFKPEHPITLKIAPGHARLGWGKDKDGKWTFIISVSNSYKEPGDLRGNGEDFYKDVLYITIDTAEQAMAYSHAFARFAERIKEEDKDVE